MNAENEKKSDICRDKNDKSHSHSPDKKSEIKPDINGIATNEIPKKTFDSLR